MDTIKTYLDNVFAAFKQTEQSIALKRDMLAGMEEKYVSLRQQGSNEHEAIGIIIANFGSIYEIAAALGEKPEGGIAMPAQFGQVSISRSSTTGTWSDAVDTPSDDWVNTSYEDARDYLAHHKRHSYYMGFGIWLALIGGGAINWFGGATGTVLLTIFLTAATGIIVSSIIKMYYYGPFLNKNARLDNSAYDELAQDHTNFMPHYVIKAVLTCVVIILGIWTANGHEMANVILMPAIGFAIFLYVPMLVTKAVYDYFLCLGAFYYKSGGLAIYDKKKLITLIAMFFAYVIAASWIFALWGYISNNMSISWVVWPISYILFCFVGDSINWSSSERRSNPSQQA